MSLPQYSDHFGSAGSSVLVKLGAATASLFSDAAGTVSLANPITLGPQHFVSFYAAAGTYTLNESGNGSDKRTVTLTDPLGGTSLTPVYHYEFEGLDASGTFFGLRDLTAVGDAPLVTPDQSAWDSTVGDGATVAPVPSLVAGSYLLAASNWSVTGSDSAGFGAFLGTGPLGPNLYAGGFGLQPWIVVPADDFLAVFVSFDNAESGRTITGSLYIQRLA